MSTGGRVFPSITGGGLTAATGAILDAQMSRRVAAQEDRRLDITERVQKINQLTALTALVPPGTTLGSLGPAGMKLFTDALGVDSTGLENLELNPKTFQTALDSMRQEFLDTPEAANLILPSTRVALGLPASGNVSELQDLEAELRAQALGEIREDPEFMSEFVARALGRDPVKLRIPGVPGEIEFESSQAAAIYAQFLLAREDQSFRINLERKKAEGDVDDPLEKLTEEIRKAVSDAGFSIGSDVLIKRVLPLYNAAVQSGNPDEIAAFLNDTRTTPGERLAMEFILGSISAGDAAFFDSVSPELGVFFRFSDRVNEAFPDDPAMAARLLQDLTQSMDPTFTAQARNPFFGRLRLEINGVPIGDETLGPTGGGGVVPGGTGGGGTGGRGGGPGGRGGVAPVMEATDQEIISALEQGDTRESLVAIFGEDRLNVLVPITPVDTGTPAQSIPEGGFDPETVGTAFRADALRLNALLRVLERTQGGLSRKNLENSIETVRTRIERGMKGGN